MMKALLLAAAVAGVATTGHLYRAKVGQAANKAVAATTGMKPAAATGIKPLDPNFVPPTEIGMNMSPLVWYLKEEILSDPLRGHAEVEVGSAGNPVLKDQVQRDANGWPINVKKGTKITFMMSPSSQLVRRFRCKFSPGWSAFGLLISQAQVGNTFTGTTNIYKENENTDVEFTAEKEGASLTDVQCEVIEPKVPPSLFRPEFMADIKPFRVIRFMNWMQANGPQTGKWADRPTPKTLSFSEKGMPLEYMVEMANLGDFDPWFTLPLNADEDYVRNFATYVRDHLKPGLRAYVEVSNEVWNSTFGQSKDATRLGRLRYPSVDEIQANDFYYADRVRQEMKVWTDVFKGQENRTVRILSNQAAWAQRADNALGHEQTYKYVDALSIAPYFGDTLTDVPGKGPARVDTILGKIPAYVDKAIGWAKDNKIVANKYGLPLYAYEAGPGLNAFEPTMVKDVQDAVDDQRFVALYARFIERWRKEIGGTLMLYNYGEGVWGHLKQTGQPWYQSTKMSAAYMGIAALPNQRDRLPEDAREKLTQ